MTTLRSELAQALADAPGLLEVALAVHAAGSAAFPAVRVSSAALATRVRTRAGDEALALATIGAHDADLYLATALAEGDAAALTIFERDLLPDLDAALARLRLDRTITDELRQTLRVELLVAPTLDTPPRIDGYLGLGPLGAWLRVTATRRALKLLRATQREDTLDERVLVDLADASSDPARRTFHREYAAHLKGALADAIGTLTVRERNLLKQSTLDELTIDELALMYRVHRATCARWLVESRASLARATRRALADRLGPRDGQLDSVLRFVDSDLELSLSRLLRAPADGT